MFYLFLVIKEKSKRPCPFASSKKPTKRKRLSNSFDKDRADVLAASHQGFFEQEKLIALDEEEQSRWENKRVGASQSKILRQRKRRTCRTRLTGVMAKVGWSNNCCQQSLASKSCEISFLPVLSHRCDFDGECFCKIWAWFILHRVLSKRALPLRNTIKNYYLPCCESGRIQILQRIFPTRNNI